MIFKRVFVQSFFSKTAQKTKIVPWQCSFSDTDNHAVQDYLSAGRYFSLGVRLNFGEIMGGGNYFRTQLTGNQTLRDKFVVKNVVMLKTL